MKKYKKELIIAWVWGALFVYVNDIANPLNISLDFSEIFVYLFTTVLYGFIVLVIPTIIIGFIVNIFINSKVGKEEKNKTFKKVFNVILILGIILLFLLFWGLYNN